MESILNPPGGINIPKTPKKKLEVLNNSWPVEAYVSLMWLGKVYDQGMVTQGSSASEWK